MKTLITSFILLIAILLPSSMNAQKRIQFSPVLISDFSLKIKNVKQTPNTNNKFEFDVYLLDMDAAQAFELISYQFGILINSTITTGTLSAAIDNSTTGFTLGSPLIATALPNTATKITTSTPNQVMLKMIGGSSSTLGNAQLISTSLDGTLMTHFIITSSVPFTNNTLPNLTFCSDAVLTPYYPTRLGIWDASLGNPAIQLVITPGTNAIVVNNPILNPSPSAFAVSGSGSYCQNTGGLPVGLTGSEVGATYTLYDINNVAQGSTVLGTGAAISFVNQLAGTYTVQGVNANGSTVMNGSVVISENPVVAAGVSITASANPVNTGITVTFTATPVGGGTTPTYQWYNGAALVVGANSSTYVYIPTNGDIISVAMTSNAPCATGSPITCIPVTMSVSLGTSFDPTKMSIDIYSKDKNILVTCSQKAKQVCIYNTLGSLVMMENNVTGWKKFDMNNYPNEYYFVKVITDNNVYTQKVLLK